MTRSVAPSSGISSLGNTMYYPAAIEWSSVIGAGARQVEVPAATLDDLSINGINTQVK